jgi:hypothetical protein
VGKSAEAEPVEDEEVGIAQEASISEAPADTTVVRVLKMTPDDWDMAVRKY